VEHIIDQMIIEAKKLIPGKNLGPVISKAAYERIIGYIEEARRPVRK
jgi:malonate-semialdehyde dehydrogenase (acetylating)/methylmalonate-semialdehyde dehydrogenase